MTWRATRLKHLSAAPITSGLGEAGAFADPSWPRYVRTTDIAGPTELRSDTFASLPPEIARKAMLQYGDIVMTTAGATIGKSMTFLERSPACYAGFLARFRAASGVDRRFIAYWMQSKPYWAQIDAGAVRSTIDNFAAGRYQNLTLDLPELEDQRRIADFLDDQVTLLDAVRRARQSERQLLQERFAVEWSTRVTSLVDPRDWVPLRRVLHTISDGPFGTSLTSADYSSQGARVIRLGNLGSAEFLSADEAYIPMSYFETLKRHQVEPGDLLVAGLGDDRRSLGRACLVPSDLGPALVKADCFRVRLDRSRISHEFAAWALSSPPVAAETQLVARGATRARINTTIAREMRIPIPATAQQDRMVKELADQRDQIVSAMRKNEHSMTLLDERRQALITSAVAGQFDVTTARSVA